MSLPTNFQWTADHWKPSVGPNDMRTMPFKLCDECHKPLPDHRPAIQIVHAGPCHVARTKRIAARASKRQEARRKAGLAARAGMERG
jgi:hypothetical protein